MSEPPPEPDPLPPPPPPPPGADPELARTYNAVADKVGLVPNVRLKDNLLSLAGAAIGTLVGVVIGFFIGGLYGVLLGGLAGFIVGGGLVGFYLMIAGLLRKV